VQAKKLKILFVIPTLSGGGAERVVSILSGAMLKKGFDVAIHTTQSSKSTYELEEGVKHLMSTHNKKSPFIIIRQIRQAMKDYKPDIVISFLTFLNCLTLVACRRFKGHVIVSERNDPALETLPRRIARKILYRRADGFVFQTETAKAYFSKKIQGRSTVIGNPLKPDLPNRHNGQRAKRIIGIGRLERQKNFPLLIESFKEFNEIMPNYTLEIFGEGYMLEQLQKQIETLRLDKNAFLRGFASKNFHNDIKDSMMYVLSSDFEGVSNAMLECMAIGIPTISTDQKNGGPRQYINHGENGLIVPLCDKKAMVNAMLDIAKDEKFADKLSQNATKVREELSMDKIASDWADFINLLH